MKSLLDDYIAPDVDVGDVVFHCRLQVFKQSEDQTYEHILAQHTLDEQRRIEAFVAREKPEEVSKDFTMGSSLGCRQLLEKMHSCESVVHISGAGPIAIKGLRFAKMMGGPVWQLERDLEPKALFAQRK